MRFVIITLLTVGGFAIAMPASAQRLHIDTPIGDIHVGQGRDSHYYRNHDYDRPRGYGHDNYGHNNYGYRPRCRQIEYHDHHGDHRVRTVCR